MEGKRDKKTKQQARNSLKQHLHTENKGLYSSTEIQIYRDMLLISYTVQPNKKVELCKTPSKLSTNDQGP